MKLLEGNIEENLYEFGLHNDFLNITPKHKQQQKKMDK